MTAGSSGPSVPPRLIVLAGRKGRPSLLPFVCVLLVVLAFGLIALLLVNTAVNKNAFELKKRQNEQTKLTQQAEQYQQELAKLSEPGALASRASELGMVPGGNPAFLDPSAGTLLGTPSPAATPAPSVTPTPTPSSTASTTAPSSASTTPTSTAPPPQQPAGAPVVNPTSVPATVATTTTTVTPQGAQTTTVAPPPKPAPKPTATPTGAGG